VSITHLIVDKTLKFVGTPERCVDFNRECVDTTSKVVENQNIVDTTSKVVGISKKSVDITQRFVDISHECVDNSRKCVDTTSKVVENQIIIDTASKFVCSGKNAPKTCTSPARICRHSLQMYKSHLFPYKNRPKLLTECSFINYTENTRSTELSLSTKLRSEE